MTFVIRACRRARADIANQSHAMVARLAHPLHKRPILCHAHAAVTSRRRSNRIAACSVMAMPR